MVLTPTEYKEGTTRKRALSEELNSLRKATSLVLPHRRSVSCPYPHVATSPHAVSRFAYVGSVPRS